MATSEDLNSREVNKVKTFVNIRELVSRLVFLNVCLFFELACVLVSYFPPFELPMRCHGHDLLVMSNAGASIMLEA